MNTTSVQVPIEDGANVSLLSFPGFIVSGPTSDFGVQITFCHDLIVHKVMTVDTVSPGAPAMFDNQVVRQVLARVKLSPPQARQLAEYLTQYANNVDAALGDLGVKQ